MTPIQSTLTVALAAIRAADNQIFRIGGHGALSAQLAQARDLVKDALAEQSTTFTVLLQRPDYVANDSLDTYLTTGKGNTPHEAVDKVRLEAAACDGCEPEAAIDYIVLFICAGEVDDLTYLIDNK